MKNQRKKTTHPIDEILLVTRSRPKDIYGTLLRFLPNVADTSTISEHCFTLVGSRVVCQKRRGEVVKVTYTSVFEEEL